jgi:outer membrane protein assembly factor BamA
MLKSSKIKLSEPSGIDAFIKIRRWTILLALLCGLPAMGQRSKDSLLLEEIIITGLQKVKPHIVYRELDFKRGHHIAIADTAAAIKEATWRLQNTTLFLYQKISIRDSAGIAKVSIKVKERFFTYLIPIFGLADRNFNEWWVERNHDLSRLEWGGLFIQRNVRGRNETLRIRAELGFTKKIEVEYALPYIDKALKTGLSVHLGYILNPQIAIQTVDNKLFYVEEGDFMRKRIETYFTLSRRNNYFTTHNLSLGYFNNRISDTAAALNPEYFLKEQSHQVYPRLRYSWVYNKRDYIYYPLHGHYIRLEYDNQGLWLSRQIQYQALKWEISGYKPLSKKWFISASHMGKTSAPTVQPYFNQRGLGYLQEMVAGYEYYVIDGQHWALFKSQLRYRLLATSFSVKQVPIESFRNVPFALYLKTYADAGYVADRMPMNGNERLSNKWLGGAGIGIDAVTYYDMVFRMEYSVNTEGESGLFLNYKAAF